MDHRVDLNLSFTVTGKRLAWLDELAERVRAYIVAHEPAVSDVRYLLWSESPARGWKLHPFRAPPAVAPWVSEDTLQDGGA